MKVWFLCLVMAAQAAAQQPSAWQFVAPDSRLIVAMHWRKVLESPYSVQLRREVPAEAAAILKGIHFIEGIEQALLAKDASGDILVLDGKFDFTHLRELVVSEGAAIETGGPVELVVPPDADEETALLAFSPPRRILLGRRASIEAAIERALERGGSRPEGAAGDLYIRTPTSWVALKVDGARVQAAGRIQLAHEVIGISDNGAIRMNSPDGRTVNFAADFNSKEEFEPYAGRLREFQLPAERAGGTIRIYGLEEGVREVAMPPLSR